MARTHAFCNKIKEHTMHSKKIVWLWVITLAYCISQASYASIIVPMTLVSMNNNGKRVGSVKLDDTLYGLLLTPTLHSIPAGIHGWQIHTLPFCSNYAKAAGGHLDINNANVHLGPYNGHGHIGDLPVLIVQHNGKAALPVVAPRLKLRDIVGRTLVINVGGDNYSDSPEVNGGGIRALACGIIPYH